MKRIEELIEDEATSSETNSDAPIPANARLSRPNQSRSTVYSVRLQPEEVHDLQRLAQQEGLPASTLVRSWITERLREELEGISDAEAELKAAQRHLAQLERHLSRRAS